jgi:cell wall-associated NlpC family hydrolase
LTVPRYVLGVAEGYANKYKEGPNNDTIFGQWYGLNHQPWCAMFVSYCFNKVGAGALVAASTPKGFASVIEGLAWFKKHKRLVPVRDAKLGDIVFFNFKNGKTPEHVGLVMSNNAQSNIIHTVEGNTGDGVRYRHRNYACVVAVARPAWPN